MMDYYVKGVSLRVIQKQLLNILVEIDKVCSEHSIAYVLDSGTMLGAVRHGGFIPWDDDLDIIMKRDDYEHFIDVANNSLPDGLVFQCVENTKDYPYNFGKVFDTRTKFVESATKDLNICHGMYVDVFPMDYVDTSDDRKLRNQISLVEHLTQMRYLKLFSTNSSTYKILISKIVPLKWLNFACKKAMLYRYKRTDTVQKICHYGPSKLPLNVSIFSDVIRVPFEGLMFPIPKDYDSFLSGRYGDYMKLPPVDKQIPGHNIIEVEL